jgi:hypothetical protein
MSTQGKARIIFGVLTLCLLWSSLPRAAELDGDAKARKGTVRCAGSNSVRLAGTEIQFASYNLRNYNSAIPITIERLTVYAATGQVLFDSDSSGLPQFPNGALGPADNVLDPNQTANIDTTDFLPFLADNLRPIQVEFIWSAPERALLLDASFIRVARQRDPATGQQLQERSRSNGTCRTISVEN